jgi:hypothetical protein
LLVDVHEKLCHDVSDYVRISKSVFMAATWMVTTFVLIDTAMTNLDHHTDVRAVQYMIEFENAIDAPMFTIYSLDEVALMRFTVHGFNTVTGVPPIETGL